MFEDGGVSAAPAITDLRQRIAALQDTQARTTLGAVEWSTGALQICAGGVYGVEHASLGLALLAGVSRSGGWCGVVGTPDLGYEHAADLGVDLKRTVVVPDPGADWVEVTAALIDVVQAVLIRPPARVPPQTAARLAARLRRRSAALVAWGPWPGCEARLRVERSQWDGIGTGHGYLRRCERVLSVERGSAPPRQVVAQPPAAAPGWAG